MRGLLIENMGLDFNLRLDRIACPAAGNNEVLVEVQYNGLNRADLLQCQGFYPAPPGFPVAIPGLEFSGVVLDGDDQWATGDRVMGLLGGGAFQEVVACPSAHLLPVPSAWGMDAAAGFPEAFMTAWDALIRQGNMGKGSKVLIHAAGSAVGLAAIQLANACDAEVVCTSRSDWKLSQIMELYDVSCVKREAGWEERCFALAPTGFDLILDLVGGEEVGSGISLVAECGKILVVGLPAGVRAELRLDKLLQKRASVIGTVLRSRSHREKALLTEEFGNFVLPLVEAGQVTNLPTTLFPVRDVIAALKQIRNNETFGKLVLRW